MSYRPVLVVTPVVINVLYNLPLNMCPFTVRSVPRLRSSRCKFLNSYYLENRTETGLKYGKKEFYLQDLQVLYISKSPFSRLHHSKITV